MAHPGVMDKLRVLLVDDSRDFLKSATAFLSSCPDFEVVGSALSAMEGIVESSRLQPDLVLMDMVMPGMNGIEATRRLKALKQPPRVVILSLHDNSEYRTAASAVGSDGYISKAEFTEKLLPMVEHLFNASEAEAGSRMEKKDG